MERRSSFRVKGVDEGNLSNRGDGVVDQAPRQRIAVRVVHELFVQRLRGSRLNAAVNLSLDQRRIQDRPAIVDRDMADQPRIAGLDVSLNHRTVAAEWKGLPVLFELV